MNLLGKVAKEFGEYVAGEDQRGVRSEDAAVEALLQRLSDGILPDDRREALAQLRDLLTASREARSPTAVARVALGNAGMPALCAVLRDERGDLDMVRGALECLVLAVQPAPAQDSSRKSGRPSPGAFNAELLVRVPGALALVLGLLQGGSGGDFYVAYHTVQLLTALGMGNMPRLLEAVLAAPEGVARLMDLLGSEHEVLRNEALLLLIGLARVSPDMQQIAAFEGAFERVLGIARDEGGADGGIVVQDCLELLNNLLRTNASNQLLFRETGHAGALVDLLRTALPAQPARRHGPARQSAGNMLAALETVHLLLTPLPPQSGAPAGTAAASEKQREESRASNQAALLRAGALDVLLGVALASGGVPSPAVRMQALHCLERLLVGAPKAQLALMTASLPLREGGTLPALQALLRAALSACNAGECAAAAMVLQAFCKGNAEGQSMLIATIMPAGNHGLEGSGYDTFGGELVSAMAGTDMSAAAQAALILRYTLDGNPAGKERMLGIPLQLPTPIQAGPPLLLPLCVSCLQAALQAEALADAEQAAAGRGSYMAGALLRLLITWLSDCLSAVQAYLTVDTSLKLVHDILTGRVSNADPVIQGLAAVLVGTCALAPSGPDMPAAGIAGGAAVLEAVAGQVGLGPLFSCIAGLRDTPAYAAAAVAQALPQPLTRASAAAAAADAGSSSDEEGTGRSLPQDNPIDRDFTAWLPAFEARLRSFAGSSGAGTRAGAASAQIPAQTSGLHDTIAMLQRQVADLQARNRALEQTSAVSNGAQAAVPTGDAAVVAVRAAEAEVRAGRAEADAASLRGELELLRGRHEEVGAGLHSAQGEAAEARAAAARLEADLEGLSSAYSHLEAHAFALEKRAREAELSDYNGEEATHGREVHSAREDDGAASAEAADADQEDGLADLLVCLGIEEQKVERMRTKLEELGVDVDSLLDGMGGDAPGED